MSSLIPGPAFVTYCLRGARTLADRSGETRLPVVLPHLRKPQPPPESPPSPRASRAGACRSPCTVRAPARSRGEAQLALPVRLPRRRPPRHRSPCASGPFPNTQPATGCRSPRVAGRAAGSPRPSGARFVGTGFLAPTHGRVSWWGGRASVARRLSRRIGIPDPRGAQPLPSQGTREIGAMRNVPSGLCGAFPHRAKVHGQ